MATSSLDHPDTLAASNGTSVMSGSISLSMSQQFEIERFSRAIDSTQDTSELRTIAKQLLQAWHTQKAATHWVIAQQMGPSRVDPQIAASLGQGLPEKPDQR